MNAVWLVLSMVAQDRLARTKALGLEGELARSEPKRPRHRPLHVAGRLAFCARHAILHLDRDWPRASELAAAFARLAALPPPARRAPPDPTTTPAVPPTASAASRSLNPRALPRKRPDPQSDRPLAAAAPANRPITAFARPRQTNCQRPDARSGLVML
jgi:hypothetical protein